MKELENMSIEQLYDLALTSTKHRVHESGRNDRAYLESFIYFNVLLKCIIL